MKKSNILPFPVKMVSGVGGIYRLRVEIEKTEPVIYRVLLVYGNIGLDLLHAVLQVAIGWTNSHLHKFTVGNSEYSDPEFNLNEDAFEGQKFVEDEGIVNLNEVVPHKGFQFSYEYDFGDSWEHLITVEDILPDDGTLKGFAECIDGKRACPPEDCGGTPGYADFLDTISDPESEEYTSMIEWIGRVFDPESFDIKKVNRFLKKIKWDHPTIDQLGKLLQERDTPVVKHRESTKKRK
jgi:hypothetical protein